MTVQASSGKLTAFGVAVTADPRGRVELAHEIGIDPSTLWRWAVGRSQPQSDALKRVAARVLGRTVRELWPHGPAVDHTPAVSDPADRSAA